MREPQTEIDWFELAEEQRGTRSSAGISRRLHWILAFYALALTVVLGRAVQLELSQGQAFRSEASRPIEQVVPLVAERGRILGRNGTVLAADHAAQALAVHYRYLQSPPDDRWLKRQVRERLTRAERRDPVVLDAAEDAFRGELRQMHRRLAALSGVSEAEWNRRTARIQRRVEQLADDINRRRHEKFAERTSTVPDESPVGVASILAGLFAPPAELPPAEITVAEQIAYHRVVDELPPEAAEAIAQTPAAYPGVKITAYTRRAYPQASLAANVVGHVSSRSSARATMVPIEPGEAADETLGLLGIEREFQSHLAGTDGVTRRFTDRRGELLESRIERRATPGRDLVLTLDVELQRFAEQLLDRFARRQDGPLGDGPTPEQGGAMLVMDIHSGEILTVATQPRFDPNWFATGDARVEAVLNDPERPLFDRATRMAIPPGSVFKTLTAVALLEHGVVRPETQFTCQGYLDETDRMRCQIFRQHGIGHGDVILADALGQSCNVYFFRFARALGPEALLAWGRRFGLGRSVATDLGELTGGHLPTVAELAEPNAVESFAIGQSTLATTPLEVLCLYAAIANGGYRLEPRFTRRDTSDSRLLAASTDSEPHGTRIDGLDERTLVAVRGGLERAVDDPSGTAFDSARMADFPIAGKTGTAQTGAGQDDHLWFAGYAPAKQPRVAFVVVLQHGGSSASAAATMARHVVQRMRQLGYFPERQNTAAVFPPGKG